LLRPLRGHADARAARQGRLRLRPRGHTEGQGRRPHHGRALARGEGRDQPPRPGRAGVPGLARAGINGGMSVVATPKAPSKSRAAAISIASNVTLIVLKLAAGAITGSIAIITEAIHSSIDLLASMVAFFSVRKAEELPDPSHPYGHEKVENLTAALEGVLILVGAAIIIFESVRRLAHVPQVRSSASASRWWASRRSR